MSADLPAPGSALTVAQRSALFLLRAYQLLFSPMFAGSCRFTPSCSRYAAGAIERFGMLRGGYLAARRLLRCHPFGAHGVDPVPVWTAPFPESASPSLDFARNRPELVEGPTPPAGVSGAR